MTRLLHAAARGARIEKLNPCNGWMETLLVGLSAHGSEKRIHPDDEHLQYGPISTALRDTAAKDFDVYADQRKAYTYAAFEMADTYETSWQNKYETELHRSLFLLILAEALADEGL